MPYYVYILQCADKTYYCGYTTNLQKRLLEHNESKKGAKYTQSRKPVVLKYNEKVNTLSQALKREYGIKRLSHKEKALLIDGTKDL